jgi:uncharacterized protein
MVIFNPGEDMENMETILWRGILQPGHEACRLVHEEPGWRLDGTAVFLHDLQTCLLTYKIDCDSTWRTVSAMVEGWIGKKIVSMRINTDTNHRWWLNGVEVPEVAGCLDLDLNFSPSTNLIPIRRLSLEVGEMAGITAAWLRFPSFQLEPLSQSYQRLEELLYRYESGSGRFVADLRVNQAGFAIEYPGIWTAESASE